MPVLKEKVFNLKDNILHANTLTFIIFVLFKSLMLAKDIFVDENNNNTIKLWNIKTNTVNNLNDL